ncbi:MAG: sulfite exporter TauE/SafE family protein [Burkholderiaceae bacterium]|nr:sulfite exporter TauE/SafE family protein [Burkholderiaceae bacterium]
MLWALVAGAMVAGFVQGLSGFAFGLVAMSIWAWFLPPQIAAMMSLFGALTGQVIGAFTVRRGFEWPLLWPFLAGGLVGVPLGVWAVPLLDVQLLKAGLGALLATWCPVMLFAARLPAVRWGGRLADGVIGSAGGFMGGVGGFAGAVPTLWCALRQFPKDRQRTVVQNFNLSVLAMAFAGNVAGGNITREMLPLFALVAPAVLLPSILGSRLYIGISEQTFRRIVLTLLTFSGVALLASSVPALLAR